MDGRKRKKEIAGYELTRFNAMRHGILSSAQVLPWEDEEEFRSTLNQLTVEHSPEGTIEQHLVSEMCGILWRRRRLRLAEAAAYRRRMEQSFPTYQRVAKVALVCRGVPAGTEQVADALHAREDETDADIAELKSAEQQIRSALGTLSAPGRRKYSVALSQLSSATLDAWDEALDNDGREAEETDTTTSCKATAAGLATFLQNEVETWIRPRLSDLENRKHIREQAAGEAFDADQLERLARYETHLDRKLERTLGMLLRLQQLRFEKSVSQ